MTKIHQLSRRAFLTDFGGGTVAVAVLGLAACSDADDTASDTASDAASSTTGPSSTTTSQQSDSSSAEADASAANGSGPVEWERVISGNVSAYVLARGSELAVVDTGNPGSEAGILAAVTTLGGTWDDVGHVILTHSHNDHVGGLTEVLSNAPGATGYAGAADLDSIRAPVDLVGLNGGEEVFGLEIIATPGHTPGHISVFDAIGGLLIAGDALNESNGMILGANPSFTSDMTTADASVQALATRSFETVVVGHGEPILSGGGAAVSELAASL